MPPLPEPTLRLVLACGCAADLGRPQPAASPFVLAGFAAAPGCRPHAAPPVPGTPVRGFGPYPDWDANVAQRVASVPEAGGMMEREHAFILDGQFLFLDEAGGPRPLGPIRDASWSGAALANH